MTNKETLLELQAGAYTLNMTPIPIIRGRHFFKPDWIMLIVAYLKTQNFRILMG